MDSQPPAMHHHLRDYLAGRLPLDELKERLVDATWDREAVDPSHDQQLAYDIEPVLAEASSGRLTPDELRSDLQALLDRASVTAPA